MGSNMVVGKTAASVVSRPVGSVVGSRGGAGGGVSATGGTITESGGYRIHTFTSSGDFVVSGGSLNVEYLIVAGGGGGGASIGGAVVAVVYVPMLARL